MMMAAVKLITRLLPRCFAGAAAAMVIPCVEPFLLERYLGRWYEIARLPFYFERDLHQVTADYTLMPDGQIAIVNRGVTPEGKSRESRAVGRFRGERNTGDLEVSFFRPFWGDYRVLATDYETYAIVGTREKNRLWILSRTPGMPLEKLDELLQLIRKWGYPVEELEFPLPVHPAGADWQR